MKKLLWLFSVLLASFALQVASAQPYGNEWINYSKTYYKFKVGSNALYRIPYSTLQASGLGTLSGAGFKVFHKGIEVPIYLTTGGTLGVNDYIELFGERNDGSFDTQLYKQADWQLNPYNSMFSDNSFYYLVWDNTTPGLRYTNQNNNISSPPAAETYFMHTVVKSYKNVAVNGKPFRLGGANHWFADFEDGEGLGSLTVASGGTLAIDFNTPAKYVGPGSPAGDLTVAVAGVSNDAAFLPDHAFTVQINSTTYMSESFEGYDFNTYNSDVFLTDIGNTTVVNFEATGGLGYLNQNTIPYAVLTYPRTFDFANQKTFGFTLETNGQKYLEITNFNGGANPVLYDLTNKLRLTPVLEGGVYKFLLPSGTNPFSTRKLYFSTTDAPCNVGCTIPECNPAQCTFYTVPTLESKQFTNFGAAANQGDYIMITNNKLRLGATDWVAQYETYRQSADGGGYNVVVVDIDELYDQFAAGIPKHPMSIRNFLSYAIDQWSVDPRFVLLLGKSISYNNFSSIYFENNLVPTFGYSPSDNMLTVNDVNSYQPRLPVGRVSATNGDAVRAYLQKLIEYETDVPCTREAREWTKNVLHVSTAWSNAEQTQFLANLANFENTIEGVQYGGDVTTFDDCANGCSPETNPAPAFINAFNQGASLVTLFGHSLGSTDWDFDGMSQTPSSYSNFGKYPFILANSCFVGNVHQYSFTDANNSLAERYTLADNLGAIAYAATVFFGIPSYLDDFSERYYEHFANSDYGQPMGASMLETLNEIYNNDPTSPDFEGTKVTSEEFTFVGDPAIVLAGSYDKPEFIIQNNGSYTDVQIRDSETNALLATTIPNSVDSIDVTVHLTNIGQILNGNVQICIQRQVGAGTPQTVVQQLVPNPITENTYTFTIPVNANTNSGNNIFTVVIDCNNQYTEDCEDNNQVVLSANVESSSCAGLAPPVISNSIANSYCANAAPVTLLATPAGGTFSGTGVSGNTFNPSGLSPNTYTITYTYVYPENGCSVFAVKNITINAQPSAQFVPTAVATCVGTPITLNVTAYDPSATYTWNLGGGIGGGTQQNQVATWNTPGNKTVTLTVTKNGCTGTQSIPVTVEAPLLPTTVSCQSTTLSSVTFTWTPVAGATLYDVYANGSLSEANVSANTFTIPGLDQGEQVSLTVVAVGTGACGNSVQSAPQTCVAQNCPSIDLTIAPLESNTEFCKNESPVTLTSNPTGGVFAIDGNTVTSITPALLGVGTHIVTVDYIDGDCAYDKSYTINIYDTPTPEITGATNICAGTSQTLSVADNFDSYIWSTGAQSSSIIVTTAGSYAVTVTNTAGCSAADNVIVTTVTEPTLDIAPTSGFNQICAGGVLTLSATAGFQAYNWSGGSPSSPSIVVVTAPGIYSVTATDATGCQWSESINITQATITEPAVSLNGQTTNTGICGGSDNTLDAGTGYASYNWSTGATSQQITITQANTYCVTVTNSAACSAVSCFEVTNNNLNAPQVSASATEICNDPVTLTVGSAYDSYTWTGGATTQQISVDAAGTYYVTVTDNGCQATESITIAQSAQATPTAAFTVTGATTLCSSGNLNITNQSVNADTYLWTLTNVTNGATQTSNDPEPNFSVSDDGTYNLNLVVSAICGSATANSQQLSVVTVASAPTIDVTADLTKTCSGDPVVLTVTTNASSFQWLENGTPIGATGSPLTVNPIRDAVYTVVATNQFNCSVSDSIAIEVDDNCELPNAITPNGDGFNDTWQIPQANTTPNISVQIFNRWGQLVWSTSAYSNASGAFDGTNMDGTELSEGTYYYLIEGVDNSPLSGPLTVIR